MNENVYVVGDDNLPISISIDELPNLEKVFGNKIEYWETKEQCQLECNKLNEKTGRKIIKGGT